MAALETWKTAMSSITFSVFLEITVLLKKIYQLKPKKSSFPLPLSLPSDTKTWRNPYSWNYFHEKYIWDLCWSTSNNIKLTALCWQYNSSVEDSFGSKIDQRFMRTKCLPRAPVRDTVWWHTKSCAEDTSNSKNIETTLIFKSFIIRIQPTVLTILETFEQLNG